jgi:xylulokinase
MGLTASVDLVRAAGTTVSEVTVTGGGTRSAVWMQMLADTAGITVVLREGADAGPALGAARLALVGVGGVPIARACAPGPIAARLRPRPRAVVAYGTVKRRFTALYPALQPFFAALDDPQLGVRSSAL